MSGRLEIVGDTCTIYLDRRSEPVVARLLGKTIADGVETLYLDRLVHDSQHTALCGYAASGAVSTILSRAVCD